MTKVLFVCHGKPRWQTIIFRQNAANRGKAMPGETFVTPILLPFYYH